MTDAANAALAHLADAYWTAQLAAEPTEAHILGRTEYAGAYENATRAHDDERVEELRRFAAGAAALTNLSDDDTVTQAVIIADATNRADMLEARLSELGADPIFGTQTMAPTFFSMFNVPDADVAEAMVSKIEGLGRWFGDFGERQREGVTHGRVSARFAIEATIGQLDAYLAGSPDQDPIVAAIQAPESVDSPAWRDRLRDAVAKHVRPGMEFYRDALASALPEGRPDEEVGLGSLSDGAAAYATTLRFFTTTDMTAEEIHEVGLAQIEKLAGEYRELGARELGTSDVGEIFDRMRNDPALHFQTAQPLVDASTSALAKAWAAMDDWFEVLPQAPCAVEGVTTGAKAFYYPPAPDGSRGGTFFVNNADPTSWGTFELEAMAYHEGVPGHHLQLAIAGELPDTVPDVRKFASFAAYAEGWGLYSERLADEMGLYTTGIDRLGMLSADSMRACRLVVDTGLHALGWSRRQAVDYMVANSPLTEGVCGPEIDRYIVYPGQACSYMIGRLEILRMRAAAQARQGSEFDIKKFHSAVLDSGLLPLTVLDNVVSRRLP